MNNQQFRGAEAGGHGWNLERCTPLAGEELDAWVRRYRETGCQRARSVVVESHLRLIAKICRRWAGKAPFEDLMAEGAMALLRALESFDLSRGVRFTSYAAAVVEHAVHGSAAVYRGAASIPVRERRHAAQRYHAEQAFYARHGYPPTTHDLAGLSVPPGGWRGIDPLHRAPAPIGGGVGNVAGLDPAGAAGGSPVDSLPRREDLSRMTRAAALVPGEFMEILAMRYGLGGRRRMSVAQIATVKGISGRRAELLLAEAARRFRAAMESGA